MLFPPEYRGSGLLLHVTSLPSPYGIGDVGPGALSWIDRLSQSGQSWWQALPLGPTGYNNSPYEPLSSFAGNTTVISPEWLIEDHLLQPSDCSHTPFPVQAVDYDAIIPFKHRLLEKAWERFKAGGRADLRPAYEQFCRDQAHWLEDYSLFRALKTKFGEAHYLDWPPELVHRKPPAIELAQRELADQIGQARFAQFLLFRQTERLKEYAHGKGVKLIGDLPFFVAGDSSDVWADPELFRLDDQLRPRFVAGVPPDYFSATGQLWGNPVYNWDNHRQSGYRWWIDRLRSLLTHVDVIRLDHFRGFVAAWNIPAGAPTAQVGSWVPGPGAEIFRAAERELHGLPFIAEDLGMLTPDVPALRDEFQLPGMRILQFAFDGHPDNPYLPENFSHNNVVYTGTHDNPTTREWFEDLPVEQRENVWRQLRQRGAKSDIGAWALMELAWTSVAALAIVPLQDILNLGREARMNVPGHPEGNWRWRCTEAMFSESAFAWLRDLSKDAKRARAVTSSDSKTLEAAAN